MSTAVVEPPPLVGEVRHQRVVQVKPYESETVSHSVQYMIDPAGDPEENIARGVSAGIEAKETVYKLLGLDAEIGSDDIPMERVTNALGGEVIPIGEGRSAGSDSDAGASPPHPVSKKKFTEMNDIEKQQHKANQEWAKDRYDSNPDEFFDNRPDKAAGKGHPKGPDLKHKTTGVAFWVD